MASVFVVSGGARGITAQCVLRLARYYQGKWLLLGRSELMESEPPWSKDCFEESELKKRIVQDLIIQGEKPTPKKVQQIYKKISCSREIKQTLSRLIAKGNQAQYLNVDVTDANALKEKLADAVEEIDSIKGIIHGAGNLADKWIENKTEQDFENVYAAKVKGLENLLTCVEVDNLDYLVLFSSTAGFFGNAGQSDYAIANEILNKSAHILKQKHPHCSIVAINWGPWDSGMVSPQLKKVFADRGIDVIPIEVGAQMLLEELASSNNHDAQVVIGSLLTQPAEGLDTQLRSYRIYRQLSLADNSFLEDHAIATNPVLPATCAVAWMAHTCEQLYPGYSLSRIENFKVLKGIVFESRNQVHEFIIDVREVAKTDSQEISFEVRIWSEIAKDKIRFHYIGLVELCQEKLSSPIYNLPSYQSDQEITGQYFYQKQLLFHGSSFQGIEKVFNLDTQSLAMECYLQELDARKQGQFPLQSLNPYSNDVLLQSVLAWSEYLYQVGCLPSEIQQITHFQIIPFDEKFYVFTEIQVKTETYVIANITACNKKGQIYMRISGIKYTISPGLNQLWQTDKAVVTSRFCSADKHR
jgi:NAD(P)-dependent dehydrogenase (short-subunit alcohol dehydrogenase family)